MGKTTTTIIETGVLTTSDVKQVDAVMTINTDDMFNRVVNTRSAIKSIVWKRTLTKPLTAMTHLHELVMKCTSEMYAYELPTKGRSEKMAPATLIDCVNLETGEELILILNAVIKSALERAAAPLIGRSFGIRESTAVADKAYKLFDVVELTVTE